MKEGHKDFEDHTVRENYWCGTPVRERYSKGPAQYYNEQWGVIKDWIKQIKNVEELRRGKDHYIFGPVEDPGPDLTLRIHELDYFKEQMTIIKHWAP